MIVAAPMNEEELRNLMYTASLPRSTQAFSIRYPRGLGVMANWRTPFQEIRIGRGRKLCDGEELAILTIGHIGNNAVLARKQLIKDGIEAAHFDLRFVKPLDEELLHEVFTQFKKIITIEDGCIQGGFGSAVLEFMADKGYVAEVRRLGIPDRIVEHGEQAELHHECGFDPEGIRSEVIKMLKPIEGTLS
jgi:1-deoxy-D-xylulose-5-phosphate synthase